MKLIDLDTKYVTRTGCAAEVLKIDAAGPSPVIVLVTHASGTDSVVRLTAG